MKKLLLLVLVLVSWTDSFAQTVANPVPDLENCGGIFDLTTQIPIVLGAQSPDFPVTFHETLFDAESGMNAIFSVSNYTMSSYPQQTLYIRVSDPEDGSSATTSFLLNWTNIQLDFMPDVSMCDAFILPDLSVGNYYTGPEASGMPLFPGDVIATTMTVYVFHAEPENNGACIHEISFVVTIAGIPDLGMIPALTACSDDPVFDLQSYDTIIQGSLDPPMAVNVSFHLTEADALNNVNPLGSTYTGTPGQTLFVRMDNLSGCFEIFQTGLFVEDCSFAGIYGKVSARNGSGQCEETDPGFPGLIMQRTWNDETVYAYTNSQGNYRFTNVLMGSNNVAPSPAFLPDFVQTVTPASSEHYYAGWPEIANFCLNTNTDSVENIYLSSFGSPRPSMATSIRLVLFNSGFSPASGNISLFFDQERLAFVDASVPATASGNIVTLNYENVAPFAQIVITISFMVADPQMAAAGDVLHYTATLSSGDEAHLSQTIVNSFDPNQITVHEGPTISQEQSQKYLHYTIEFQNMGTADALNIRINSELSDFLDWETFRPIAASHTYFTERSGKEIQFFFDDINLPSESENEPLSHGFVTYEIKPAAGFSIGNVIAGSAAIYFDTNEAIITNEVTTQIQTLSIADTDRLSFRLHPNPTSGKITLTTTTRFDRLDISDATGKSVFTSGFMDEIDVSGLAAGMYFLKITSGAASAVQKIIKQ